MLSAFANSFKIPELRQRILFTLGLIFICRIVTSVPAPGVDAAALQAVIEDVESRVGGGFLGWIDLFSGGALSKCAVGALSIWPYISASIILQLMTAIVPALERLAREGDAGRQKLTQYTRYLTLVICVIQGGFLAATLENPAALGIDRQIVYAPGWGFRLLTILTLTTGTMLLMWLGEQITERGIGNGISIVITVNIVSRLPSAVFAAVNMFRKVDGVAQFSVFHLVGLLLMIFLVTAGTIALTQGQRKIPINTTKRVVGRKVYGGQSTYMPLRVNYSGVMPIIFAGAMLAFPPVLLQKIPIRFFQRIGAALTMGEPLYLLVYAALILFFSYFWVATQFNPLQIADDLKRNGGYVPGIRPGRPTAEFLDRTMTRITLIGAVALTVIAVIPTVMATQFRVPWLVASFMGGTSLLIIVGVMLDTMRQVEAHLLMRHYDGFLKKGRLRGRR
ncbi:MAG: preprotein translocase subunit SecY [Lentisphaerae bacterium]|nr:preprotein translocase subunit SecY [Lentisphaerota bacterium]